MPRFVILEHDHPYLHWDLMLEAGAVLRTWRLAAAPMPGESVAAEPLPDHRLMYLDYEGPVSNNRGHVQRWDWGNYEGDLGGGDIRVTLSGQRLSGEAMLSAGAGSCQFRVAPLDK
jgi:hypothetical protein